METEDNMQSPSEMDRQEHDNFCASSLGEPSLDQKLEQHSDNDYHSQDLGEYDKFSLCQSVKVPHDCLYDERRPNKNQDDGDSRADIDFGDHDDSFDYFYCDRDGNLKFKDRFCIDSAMPKTEVATIPSREEEKVPEELKVTEFKEPIMLTQQEMESKNIGNEIEMLDSARFQLKDWKPVFKITYVNRATQKETVAKTRRIISKCPHTDLKYYAKGMCKKCYHMIGREKKATACQHSDRLLYAKGF